MVKINKLIRDRYGYDISHVCEPNAMIQLILSHKTCRKYSDESISEDLLALLLACAQSAPTKSNLQQYSILVVSNRDIRKKLSQLVPSMEWLEIAPVVLIFLGDVRRIRKLSEMKGYNYNNNNADTFMNASIDAALAMQNLITGAESLGLGTCPISYVRNEIDKLSRLLELPDGVFPICALTLGYKAEPGYVSMRLPQEVVVHRDRYDDQNLEVEIKKFDDRNHERDPIMPEKQRHPNQYGILSKCTWSENVCRQLSFPEREGFGEYLKGKGINLT